MPIRAGQTQAWQEALEDLTGPRYAEYETSRKRYGLASQTTFLQSTPMGDFALIHLTGADVLTSFHRMSGSQDPWDVEWRQLTRNLHGVDFAKGEAAFPAVEPGFSMQSGDLAGTRPFLFVAPLGPGNAAEFRAQAQTLMGERNAAYVKSRERIGVRREASFLQSTAMGHAVVFYWLAADPQASLARLLQSTDPFDRWLLQTARSAHPVPLETLFKTANANRLVASYPKHD
jgi:hypothetical protein